MKKLFWMILLVSGFTFTETAQAQIRKVPARVTNSLDKKFPDARNVEWRDKITCYQANFQMNGTRYEAKFSRKGHWKGTTMYFLDNNLPVVVRDGFRKSKYRGWEIRSSYITYEPGRKARYHLRVAKNNLHQKELVFSAKGQLVSDNLTV